MSSKSKRGGLGRGLGALIPTAPPVPQPSADDAPASDSGSGDVAATDLGTGGNGAARNADGHGGKGDVGGGVTAPHAARSSDDAEVGTTHSDVALAAVPGAALAELAIADIHPNPKQPRRVFDEDALNELSHSIREFGVLQPVVVRSDPSAAGGYELVMGERRLRAAAAAGLPTIPAIVRTTDDDAMLRDALLENIHRAQLNPLEEAAAYQQLLDDFGSTHDELATRLGRSRPQVSNTIRLLNLSLPVQRRVAAGVLSAGHARALLSLPERDRQDELAGRIVAEGLSVRATEELVSLAQHDSAAPKAGRRSGGPRLTAPGVAALAADLSDAFDTSVRIDIGRRKGKITIEFASIDDLERLVDLVAPDVAAARRQGAAPAPGGGAQANEP